MNTAFRLWKVQMVPVNVQSLQAIASAVRLVQQKLSAPAVLVKRRTYVVSFLGYAPAEDPQIAIYVVLNRPNAREQDLETRKACIIAKNILTEVLPYLNIFMTQEADGRRARRAGSDAD